MLSRLLLVIVLLAGLYFLVRRWRRSRWHAWAERGTIAIGVAGALLLLTVRGGAEIAVPVLVGLIPLLLRWLSTQRSAGRLDQPATVTTRFLKMTVDQASGGMWGQVQEGRFAGRTLQELTLQDLRLLWWDCQPDPQSVAALEAWLDRYAEPGWREALHQAPAGEDLPMSPAEAWQVLGLSPGASHTDVQAAYRRLIQRLHPDHGGSAWLATRLNRAREVLLRS